MLHLPIRLSLKVDCCLIKCFAQGLNSELCRLDNLAVVRYLRVLLLLLLRDNSVNLSLHPRTFQSGQSRQRQFVTEIVLLRVHLLHLLADHALHLGT